MSEVSQAPRGRREGKVGFVFRHHSGPEHTSGINAVVSSSEGSRLWTASRDGTVKEWAASSGDGLAWSVRRTFEGHTDWVNDATLCGSGELLASCSSDATVRLWRLASGGVSDDPIAPSTSRPLATLPRHGDYVTALAASVQGTLLVSAGLGGEACVWDVPGARAVARWAVESRGWERDAGSPLSPSLATLSLHGGRSWESARGRERLAAELGAGQPAGVDSASTPGVSALSPASNALSPASDALSPASNAISSDLDALSPASDFLSPGLDALSAASPPHSPPLSRRAAERVPSSIYSAALAPDAPLLALGCADGCVRVLDLRAPSARPAALLPGQGECVRAVRWGPSGALASGGADRLLRAWDVGQQRCWAAWAVHSDSVWALCEGGGHEREGEGKRGRRSTRPTWSVLSGGRDGCVYRTCLDTGRAELLVRENRPVTALRRGAPGKVWAATASSSLRLWRLPDVRQEEEEEAAEGPPRAGGIFRAPSSTASRRRMAFGEEESQHPEPATLAPLAALKGHPPIVQVLPLTSRRQVLTRDAEGEVLLWDVLAQQVLRSFGRRSDVRALRDALFDPGHAAAAWFAPDVRLGGLGGVLEPGSAFGAEAYARDLGQVEATADAKVNCGERLLQVLFQAWKEDVLRAEGEGGGENGGRENGSDERGGGENGADMRESGENGADEGGGGENGADEGGGGENGTDEGGRGETSDDETQKKTSEEPIDPVASPPSASSPPTSPADRPPPASPASLNLSPPLPDAASTPSSPNIPPPTSSSPDLSPPSSSPPLPPAPASPPRRFPIQAQASVMVLGGSEEPWRMAASDLDRRCDIPAWAAACVLHGRFPAPKSLKLAFHLVPLEQGGLPSLLQSRLHAPRVLRVSKVAEYLVRRMRELGLAVRQAALFFDAGLQEVWDAAAGAREEQDDSEEGRGLPLFLSCNGMAVPWDFTLAAVRQWIWKNPEDLVINYSISGPDTMLKMPSIKPPEEV